MVFIDTSYTSQPDNPHSLCGHAPIVQPAGFVDGHEQRPRSVAPDAQPIGQRSRCPVYQVCSTLLVALAHDHEPAGGWAIIGPVAGHDLSPSQAGRIHDRNHRAGPRLDGVPGQDFCRQVIAVHDDHAYTLVLVP